MQKIIESTALARIMRAARSMTTAPGEVLNYRPGELVEFWRPPRSKDTPAWHGPAQVIVSEPSRGQLTAKWNGEEIRIRYPDVRRFIDFTGFAYGTIDDTRTPHSQVWRVLHNHIDRMQPRLLEHYGYAKSSSGWHITAESRKHA